MRYSKNEKENNLYEKDLKGLIDDLSHENKKRRKIAASYLGFIKDKRATEPLLKSLKDEDEEVRKIILQSLICIEGKIGVNALIKEFHESQIQLCLSQSLEHNLNINKLNIKCKTEI